MNLVAQQFIRLTHAMGMIVTIALSTFLSAGHELIEESPHEVLTLEVEMLVVRSRDEKQVNVRQEKAVRSCDTRPAAPARDCNDVLGLLVTTERSKLNGLGTYLLI